MTEIAPGVEKLQARCGHPDCAWWRQGIGARECRRVMRAAELHVQRKGHPVQIEHAHTAIVDFKR